jgi:ABC-2 type transport system permease protein
MMSRDSFIHEIGPTLLVEFQKVRRSKLLWMSVLVMSFVSLVAGLFMYILKDPDRALQLGLVGAKAQVFGGTADWSSFLNLLLIMMSIGGLIVFGFIFVWIFGREFSDKTVYDMLALPTSRMTIVIAKMVTGLCWSMLLVLLVFVLMFVIGAGLHLPGWSAAIMVDGLRLLAVTGLLTTVVCTFFIFIASLTRGYLAAVGCIVGAMVLGQIVTQLGYGQYYPWMIPLLYSGAAEALTGRTAEPLGFASYALVTVLGFSSVLATCLWWRHADQS